MSRVVRLETETDFDGWRDGARACRSLGLEPHQVIWRVGEASDLFAAEPVEAVSGATFAAPRRMVELARALVLHRDPSRFDLAYRLLWRLQTEPRLLEVSVDVEMRRAQLLRKEVERSAYRLKQYVRFRRIEDAEGEVLWIAWCEPEHRVLARAAPFFIDRFATMRWAILTPDGSVFWDLETLGFGPPARREDAPADDELEALWRSYFTSTFNPARLKVKAMTAQMPRRLWRNLPEAQVIPDLIRKAGSRAEEMIAKPHTEPGRRAERAIARTSRDAPFDGAYTPAAVAEIWPAVNACRRCDLWRNATQGIGGAGPATARLMLVGEQPGDQEDLAGAPFVGPAGQVLDRALAEAGIARDQCYVTNAVKHFKFEPRGKRRLHAKPNAGEIRACRWWLDHERRLVRPQVIVALGATAGQAVLGRAVSVMKENGRPLALPGGGQAIVTVHPSYMLRLPDAEAKAKAYALFVTDLRMAAQLAEGGAARSE